MQVVVFKNSNFKVFCLVIDKLYIASQMQVAADNYSDLCIYQSRDIYNPFSTSYLVRYHISTKQFLVRWNRFTFHLVEFLFT